QTKIDIEIIIVNDGSTDSSLKICKSFAEKDGRIKLINKQNGGLMSAWITGVLESHAKYIGFVDSDDFIELNMFENLYNEIIKYDADVVIDGYIQSNNNKEQIKEFDEFKMFTNNRSNHLILNDYMTSYLNKENNLSMSRWNKLYRRDIIISNLQYLDQSISLGEDVNMNFAVLADCDKIVFIPHSAHYHYVYNPVSIFNKYDLNTVLNINRLNCALLKIANVKNIDTNLVSIFIGNMIYEEINKIFINSNSFYYFKTTLTSMFAKCECINDLNRYSQKRNIFIKLFIYLILHHHFHIAYYMKKIYYLIRNEQVNG
ncbi:glycosyltransferase family 2 protein, partial [Coprobacillus cateniformis]